MKKLSVPAVALLLNACLSVMAWPAAAEDEVEGPKPTIKHVMAMCMKSGLCKKVAEGKATDKEKAALVEMFTALARQKPPRGDAESWKAKTTALVEAATSAAEGKEGAADALGKAANCGACHGPHKPK